MSNDAPTLTEDLTQGAALLSAGLSAVSKADDAKTPPPFAKKDDADEGKKPEDGDKKDEEKTEKGLSGDELVALVDAAVEKALAPLMEKLAGQFELVTKGLDAVDTKVNASMQHQKASTDVLVQFKGLAEQTNALAQQTVEVSKGIQAEVTAIGDQPAARKTVDTTQLEQVSKSTGEIKRIEMSELREVTKGLEVHERLTVFQEVNSGNYSSLNASQRKSLGL